MTDCKSILQADPTGWLLANGSPPVRYFTLRDILARPADDPEVVKARREIYDYAPARKIIARQLPNGSWEDRYYIPKFNATRWQLERVVELGWTVEEPRIRKAAEYVLQLQMAEGYFPIYEQYARYGEDRCRSPVVSAGFTCTLIKMGLEDDERVKKSYEWLLDRQRSDGGWSGEKWQKRKKGKGKTVESSSLSCRWATAGALWALTESPRLLRTFDAHGAIARGAVWMLRHDPEVDYTELGWNEKAHEILPELELYCRLGVLLDDPRVKGRLEWMLAHQREDGLWERSGKGISLHRWLRLVNWRLKRDWLTLQAVRIVKMCSYTA